MNHLQRPYTALHSLLRDSRPSLKKVFGGTLLLAMMLIAPGCPPPTGPLNQGFNTLLPRPSASTLPVPAPSQGPAYPPNFHAVIPGANGGSDTPLTSAGFRVTRVNIGDSVGKHQLNSPSFSVQGGNLEGL